MKTVASGHKIEGDAGRGTGDDGPIAVPCPASRVHGFRASSRAVVMCKAYSLDFVVCPIRRALPYANMRKGFALTRRGYANMCQGFALPKGVR